MNLKTYFRENFSDKIGFKKSFFTTFSKRKFFTTIAMLVCIIILCLFLFGRNKKTDTAQQSYVETQATISDITETIEQSGVVEPYERYEITSLVKGEILSAPFEEGDHVEEGDTLYQIDDEDAQLNMEKAQMSLEEANENVNNLSIYAPASGKLTEFSLKVGDNVGASVIGKINNTDRLAVDIPFSSSDFNKISVGDKVSVTSALYMTSIAGRVTHKYTAASENTGGGSVIRNIEVEIENPGALADGTTFAATVHTSSGDVNSAGSGTIDGGTTSSVRAEVSGEVSYIAVKNGDYVTKGQLIARLKNNSLINSQKSSILNVKSNQKTLDNYNITSPIAGTVITKNSKAGDKIDSSNSQTVMMVVADMSKMKFTITVDELDISDIHLGQTAIVDADALPEEIFEARVTNIASEGVSSGDGVTTFEIELTIDEPGNLKSGMNVNANILINEAYNVVVIPEDALMGVNGSTAMVMVKTDGKTKKENNNITGKSKKNEGLAESEEPQRPDGFEGGDMPQLPEGFEKGEMPQRPRGSSDDVSDKMPKDNISGKMNSNIPEGCEMRRVTIGISNGTMVEIVSGLSEGETVVYIPSTAGSQSGFMGMMGRMHSGMMGGGMSGGMMGGGMPSGNRSGGGMPGAR